MRSAIERSLALFCIIVIFPGLLVIALGILVSSPGPIIFRQVRVGQGGVPFVIYKFRTMYDQPWKVENLLGHDPRVTIFGSWLRKTHLDELPQLWNIVQGEMAFIGPRPHCLLDTQRRRRRCRRYRNRFQILPGITGFAQIQKKKGYSHDLFQKVAFEEYYRIRRCLRLDIEITLKTIFKMVRGSGY